MRRWIVLGVLVVGVALLAGCDVEEAAAWIRDAGPFGAVVLAVAYVVAAAFALPVAALTMTAGFAYGVGGGMAMIVPTALVGSLVGFALGRTFLRERVARRLRGDRRFRAIDRAIGADGFKITLLVRLSPILPFGVINYVLSATSVQPRQYLAATVIGVVPGTLLFVYLGSVAGQAGGGGGVGQLALWAGLAVALIAVVVVTRIARRALREVSP